MFGQLLCLKSSHWETDNLNVLDLVFMFNELNLDKKHFNTINTFTHMKYFNMKKVKKKECLLNGGISLKSKVKIT